MRATHHNRAADEQVTAALGHVVLPPTWADGLLAEAEKEAREEAKAAENVIRNFKANIQGLTDRLDRLMTAYAEGVLNLTEYREAKNKLVAEKHGFEEQMTAIGRNRSLAFEPIKAFLNTVKQAEILTAEGTDEQKRDFFKKVASNPNVFNRELRWEPRGAWKLVAGQGSFAQHIAAPVKAGAAILGETHLSCSKRRERDSNPR